MNAIVETIQLAKVYGSGPTAVQALQPTDLQIGCGEFVAIVGPSGSGKSTLLHLLGGLDKPSGGKVLVAGKDLFAISEGERAVFRRRKIGFIFQFYNLMPVLSAEENMLLPLLLDGQMVDEAYKDELLNLLGLENRRSHLPSELSGGQQQRVAIGRALTNKPAVIFADEPTGNLDIRTTQDVMQLLRETSRRFGQTLVIITHDMQVASFADRMIRIVDGKVEQ